MTIRPTELERLRRKRSSQNASQIIAANRLVASLRSLLDTYKGAAVGKHVAKALKVYDAYISAPERAVKPGPLTPKAVLDLFDATRAAYEEYMTDARRCGNPLFTYSGWLQNQLGKIEFPAEPVVEKETYTGMWEVSVDGRTWYLATHLEPGPDSEWEQDIWRRAVLENGKSFSAKFWKKTEAGAARQAEYSMETVAHELMEEGRTGRTRYDLNNLPAKFIAQLSEMAHSSMKIDAIKCLRAITSCGLKEAVEYVNRLPAKKA